MKTNADKKVRLPVFRERFDELRENRSYAAFAEFLGLSRATVGFYLAGERVPDAITLKTIAEKCNVPVDYLLGLSDAKLIKNTDISSAIGLSDKAIERLRKMTAGPVRRIAVNAIIEDGEILRYSTAYLLSFLEKERRESKYKNVPVSHSLSAKSAEVNLVRLIERLPVWRNETIEQLKEKPELVNEMLLRYISRIVDQKACEYAIEEPEMYCEEDDSCWEENPFDPVYDLFDDESVKAYEDELNEQNAVVKEEKAAIIEVLSFMNNLTNKRSE